MSDDRHMNAYASSERDSETRSVALINRAQPVWREAQYVALDALGLSLWVSREVASECNSDAAVSADAPHGAQVPEQRFAPNGAQSETIATADLGAREAAAGGTDTAAPQTLVQASQSASTSTPPGATWDQGAAVRTNLGRMRAMLSGPRPGAERLRSASQTPPAQSLGSHVSARDKSASFDPDLSHSNRAVGVGIPINSGVDASGPIAVDQSARVVAEPTVATGDLDSRTPTPSLQTRADRMSDGAPEDAQEARAGRFAVRVPGSAGVVRADESASQKRPPAAERGSVGLEPECAEGQACSAVADVAPSGLETLRSASSRRDETHWGAVESVEEPVVRIPVVAALDWDALERSVSGCVRCPELVASRQRTVLGAGNRSARWMFVGEAPGVIEDRQGLPFVGPAGQLLDRMLDALGLDRDREVYLANVLKCRPPRNRDPRPEEVAHCADYLHAQIAAVAPSVLVALGRHATASLLQQRVDRLGDWRGRAAQYQHSGFTCPVVVTFHPAALLRASENKAAAWQDLLRARAIVSENRASLAG